MTSKAVVFFRFRILNTKPICNLSKRVVKLLANILEGWHSGYCGGIANPLVVVRRRASPNLASSDNLYEMVSNSGEGLVVPYDNLKKLT